MKPDPHPPLPERPRVPLPSGYRQAIVSAITVLLGFSLLFLRFYNFELSGPWDFISDCTAVLLALAIICQFVALWRALRVEDDDEAEYGTTLRWFLAAVIMLMLSLLGAVVAVNL
jgi:hypothetical protein